MDEEAKTIRLLLKTCLEYLGSMRTVFGNFDEIA